MFVASVAARKMRISNNTATMVGCGTAICGGTAVVTSASIINAREEEIAYAITAIFFFDLIGALFFPYLAFILKLTNERAGFLIGAAVNDMASVIAAEATYNAITHQNMNISLTVKLARTTLLIPLSLFLVTGVIRRNVARNSHSKDIVATLRKTMPWTIVGFIVMVLFNSVGFWGWLSTEVYDSSLTLSIYLKDISKFLTTVALCGVGFKIKFRDLLKDGIRPVLLGGLAWLSIVTFTFFYLNFIKC
jgi:uncharacterized integral membrane protein (TIGR00698 family)